MATTRREVANCVGWLDNVIAQADAWAERAVLVDEPAWAQAMDALAVQAGNARSLVRMLAP